MKRLSIHDMCVLAQLRGGKCLSTNYVNNTTKLKWQCSEGHSWEATPKNIRKGVWCSRCAGVHPYTIQDMQALAEQRGGRCISKEYTNVKQHLSWQCKEGHTWEATPGSVVSGRWCRICGFKRSADSHRGTIEEMRSLAEKRGGKCLSTNYVNNTTKLKWQCSEGHSWEATPNNIKKGRWCPTCARRKRADARRGTIEEMHRLAESRGGKCLSTNYVNNRTMLEWQCKEGHIWEARPDNIKYRTQWCRNCSGRWKRHAGLPFTN